MTDGLFKNFFRLSIGPIGILATILATAVVTTLGNSYVNLIQHNRTVVEADFAKFKETSGEFFQLLEAYSRLARDGTPVDESTKNRFTQTLLKLYHEAEVIAKRQPELQPDFEHLSDALLSLQAAALELKGPLNGQKFVQTTSEYLNAVSQFSSRVTALQGRLISTL